jgi:hypothetical protein
LSNKTGSGLHHARRSYGYEHSAGVQRPINSLQLERHLAEPADVGANLTTTFASWYLRWRLPEIRVVKWRAAARVATTLEKLSVHVGDVSRTSLLVKAIYVLGADEKAFLQHVFKSGEGEVCGVRFGCRSDSPTHGVELPDQPGIAVPSKGRSDLLDPVTSPESTTPRKVGMPLSAITLAPARMKMRSVGETGSMDEGDVG